jgi:hypothetical protein
MQLKVSYTYKEKALGTAYTEKKIIRSESKEDLFKKSET